MSAPAMHKQTSRKSKKSWRKNVDIGAVESGLDSAREQYTRTGGKLLADADSDFLFRTDTTGDVDVQRKIKSTHGTLKADQIIAARSKVPAVTSRPGDNRLFDSLTPSGLKRKRGEKLSYRELERLRKLAFDRRHGHREVVQVKENAEHDPWTEPISEHPKPTETFLDRPQPIKEPKTFSRATETLTTDDKHVPNVRKPDPGRSYNPAFEDWSSLLEREGEKEVAAERKRREAALVQAERDEAAERSAKEAEEKENEDNEALSEYESEWEGFASEAEADASMLRAKRPQRKTPQERKKIERRKKQEGHEKHERRMKEREKQEKQIEALLRASTAAKHGSALQEWDGLDSDVDGQDDGQDENLQKRPRFGKRFVPPEKSLEVVLPDELQDSLRGLRPEGNLLKDRFRNYILQGKIEARKPAVSKKAKNRKATELWSYKDWKLPSQA